MALCLPTLKLFKQKHNPFKTLQPCARSSSSCTSSSFLTSLFSLRLKPLFVFICFYLSLFVFICLYLSLFVFICLYLSLFVFYLSFICLYLSLFVFICLYLSLFVFICLYLSLFVFICLYLSLFVFICLYLFLFVFICLYLSLFVFVCLYLSLICLYLSLFVKICRSCRTSPVDLIPVVLVRCKRSMILNFANLVFEDRNTEALKRIEAADSTLLSDPSSQSYDMQLQKQRSPTFMGVSS